MTKVADNERQMEEEKNRDRTRKGKRDKNYSGDERQMDLCDGWRGGRVK